MTRVYHEKLLEIAETYGYQQVLEEILHYPSEQENKETHERLVSLWNLEDE